ncbi:hypothetical protein ACQ1PF_07885 [Ornithobacterium rhinotracheale]
MNVKAILKGWKNYLIKDKATEQLAKARAKVCAECQHAKKGTYEELMPDYSMKEIKGYLCGVCGCPLSTKLRQSDELCPKGKWD